MQISRIANAVLDATSLPSASARHLRKAGPVATNGKSASSRKKSKEIPKTRKERKTARAKLKDRLNDGHASSQHDSGGVPDGVNRTKETSEEEEELVDERALEVEQKEAERIDAERWMMVMDESYGRVFQPKYFCHFLSNAIAPLTFAIAILAFPAFRASLSLRTGVNGEKWRQRKQLSKLQTELLPLETLNRLCLNHNYNCKARDRRKRPIHHTQTV